MATGLRTRRSAPASPPEKPSSPGDAPPPRPERTALRQALLFGVVLVAVVALDLLRSDFDVRAAGGRRGAAAARGRPPPAPVERCALLFFGLPKVFRQIVLPSIQKHIIAINPSCDIYVHAYNVTSTTNSRNKEKDVPIYPLEVFDLTAEVAMDTDAEFYAARDMTYYLQYFPYKYAWVYPTSLHSLIKQWHSIGRVWELMERRGRERYGVAGAYTRVGLFRSDVIYGGDIDIADGDAVIPAHSNGEIFANDRMFYGLAHYAEVWATGRLPQVGAYMKSDFGAQQCLHSERFMYWLIKELPIEYRDICFHRVRATGQVEKDDCDWEPEVEKNMYYEGCHKYKAPKRKELVRPRIIYADTEEEEMESSDEEDGMEEEEVESTDEELVPEGQSEDEEDSAEDNETGDDE